MAAKKKKASKGEAVARPERTKEYKRDETLLERIHRRFKIMEEADRENRRLGLEDEEFVNIPGKQWDLQTKTERGTRPCYEFNKLRPNGKRVINEIRANRPQGKVSAVEGGDKDGAEMRAGLIRNVEAISDIDTVTDQCAEKQVDYGYGVMRVDTEYADDSMFDQDILVKNVKNPATVYSDPACEDILLRRDAKDWIEIKRLPNDEFEEKYGDALKIDFSGDDNYQRTEWFDDDTTQVVRYWFKEPYDKTLWMVERAAGPTPQGTTERLVVDSTTDEAPGVLADVKAGKAKIIKERLVHCHKIMVCVASGDAVLEQPSARVGTQFPFVPVYGEIKVIDGKIRWHGLHRFSKDAQKVYNVNRTAAAESAHAAAKSQWWATQKQAEGVSDLWNEAHKKNFPYMLYNADPGAPGPPVRMGGPELPIAFMSLAEHDAQDIRDTSGLHEASFGEESDEKSGVALRTKQAQAQVVTYNFPDNMAKARKRIGEIILDYIPHIYDADREIRILGVDGTEKYERINYFVLDKQGKRVRVNDMVSGKYDYAVTTGPSFATMRQEAAEVVGMLIQKFPQTMAVAGDLVFKLFDYPYSEDFAKRMQHLLLPAVQKQIAEGKEIPPEVQAVLNQAEQAQAMVQEQTKLVQAAAQEVQQDKAVADKAKAEVQTALANLKAAEAQFEAKVAKVEAQFVQREAKLGMESVQLDGAKQQLEGQAKQMQSEQQRAQETIDGGNADLSEAKKAVAEIDAMVAKFMEAAASAMAEIKTATAEIKARPKLKSVKLDRSNGETRAVPEFEEEAPTVQ